MSHLARLVRLANYTRRLDSLHYADPDDQSRLDQELSKVCLTAFGASLYEIDGPQLVDLLNRSGPYAHKDGAIAFTRRHGFDIAHAGGSLLLRDWRSLTVMVMAASEGIMAPAADTFGRTLKAEAARYQQVREIEESSVLGSVRWFSPEKGFGFLTPLTDGEPVGDVWFGKHEVARGGLDTPRSGQCLAFNIAHDQRNRRHATNLKRLPHYRRTVVERHFGGSPWGAVLTADILYL